MNSEKPKIIENSIMEGTTGTALVLEPSDENGTIKKMPSMQFAFVFIQFVVLFTIRI